MKLGTTKLDLPCIFGLGKSFRREEKDLVPAGTTILSRFEADRWHKFTIEEFGRIATKAVKMAAILDAAM